MYRFEEHVGEVAIALQAREPHEVFVAAGRALAELQRGDLPVATTDRVDVELQAASEADLLYMWVNELVYLSEIHKLVFEDFEVTCRGARLSAVLFGGHPLFIKTAVKAATLHGLRWRASPDGIDARIVLDV